MPRAAVDLTRALVMVTGGSSGIGLATAHAFVERGASVVIVARTPEKLELAVAQLRDAGRSTGADGRDGFFVEAVSCDLSDAGQAREALSAAIDTYGVPDVLVNSAGLIYPGEFTSMPDDHFDANLDCGFWSVVNPCRAVVPRMVERGSGHVANVSSVAGYLGIYGYTGYSAAKFAVMGFTEALRFELVPEGLGVSIVCPPDTDTPALAFEHTLRPKETDVIAGNIRPIAPEKVARAIVKAVEGDRYLVIPDATSAFYFRLKGVAPELFYSIVDGDVRKARRES